MPAAPRPAPKSRVLALADQCVKCGLCLPHCPTYALARDESEGPRGRIALLQGVALDALTPDQALAGHLDRCLGCRACETACPAGVAYGELLDAGREMLQVRDPRRSRSESLVLWLVARRWRWRLARAAIRAYQCLGMRKPLRRTPVLRWLGLEAAEAVIPDGEPRSNTTRPPGAAKPRDRVALFAGCMDELFGRSTVADADAVLTRLGFEVVRPARQACCGALHLHAGDRAGAVGLARRNLAAFSGVGPVLYLSSGCGAQLAEYDRLLPEAGSRAFSARSRELMDFLAEHWPQNLVPEPLSRRALVHEPCTLRNVVKPGPRGSEMLRRIPGLELAPLPDNASCCGAAGTHMLTQPAAAAALRAPKLAAAQGTDFVVTGNIGCALHLASGFRGVAGSPEVLHPVSLLARQLRRGSRDAGPPW